MNKCLNLICLFALLAASLLASPSYAGAFDEMEGEGFDNNAAVSDTELSKMRGGFVNINGLLIDFSFLFNVQINGNLVHEMGFSTEDLIAAMQTGNLMQPTIISNVDNDVLIALQTSMNLDIYNGGQWVGTQTYIDSSAFQNTMALR